MRSLMLPYCLLSLLLLVNPAYAQNQNGLNMGPQIQVSGQGRVNATPDTANLSFTFSEQSRVAEQAKKLVDTQVINLLKLSKKLNVDEKDIYAANFNVYPQYDYQNDRTLTGYQVSREVKIKLRNMNNYAALLEGAVGIGASNSYQSGFEFSNREQLDHQGMQLAFADAKAKAQLLAQQAGGSLGQAVWIAESGGYEPPAPMMKAMSAEADASYSTGELEVAKQLEVRFQLIIKD